MSLIIGEPRLAKLSCGCLGSKNHNLFAEMALTDAPARPLQNAVRAICYNRDVPLFKESHDGFCGDRRRIGFNAAVVGLVNCPFSWLARCQ